MISPFITPRLKLPYVQLMLLPLSRTDDTICCEIVPVRPVVVVTLVLDVAAVETLGDEMRMLPCACIWMP